MSLAALCVTHLHKQPDTEAARLKAASAIACAAWEMCPCRSNPSSQWTLQSFAIRPPEAREKVSKEVPMQC